MKKLIAFFHDQLLFLLVYGLSTTLIILYYVLTVKNAELLYPCVLAAFFLILYLVIRYIFYMQHISNVERMKRNAEKLHSPFREYESTYMVFAELHQRYQDEVSLLKKQSIEEKRLISAFIHNLKTPVTVSDLILQQAKEKSKFTVEEVQSILENLQAENLRLNKSLSILLDLQRLSETANDYQPQAVSLSQELTKIINENKSLFIQSRVFPKLSESDAIVYTDAKWNTVLINQIISNAVKYSSSEQPKNLFFTITQEGDQCRLQIQDEGIGIPEYDLPKVFDAFFTGDNGRKGYSASGIGLYLCKQICDHLGLSISIENHNGCLVTVTYLSKP